MSLLPTTLVPSRPLPLKKCFQFGKIIVDLLIPCQCLLLPYPIPCKNKTELFGAEDCAMIKIRSGGIACVCLGRMNI